MLKKIGIFLIFLLVLSGFLAYYYWQKATTLPDWYREDLAGKTVENESSIETPRNREIESQILAQINSSKSSQKSGEFEVEIAPEDLSELLVQKLAQNSTSKQLLESSRAIKTQIKGERLEVGGIVNTADLQKASLPENYRALLGRALETFPQLEERDIYLGIEGIPQVKNGQLLLLKEGRIKLGNLSFPIEEIGQNLGLPPGQIQQYLEVRLDRLNIRDLRLDERGITVKVSQP